MQTNYIGLNGLIHASTWKGPEHENEFGSGLGSNLPISRARTLRRQHRSRRDAGYETDFAASRQGGSGWYHEAAIEDAERARSN